MSVTTKVTQAGHESQLGPHVPGRTSLEKTLPICGRQRFDILQIHLDAGCERRPDFIKGIAKGRDVEVNTDRLPHGAGPIGVTAQRSVHAHLGSGCT